MSHEHGYQLHLAWEGNRGAGTADHAAYDRRFRIVTAGKPDLIGSAAARFRGDPELPDPEDLLLAAVASCHMLSYLALCARAGIVVVAYEDDGHGVLELTPDGGGQFREITLRPRVTIAAGADRERAGALHDQAHAQCYVARSCRVPIHHHADVRFA